MVMGMQLPFAISIMMAGKIFMSPMIFCQTIFFISIITTAPFTNRVKEYFKHTSFNSMGQDVADINNDGLPDVIELDMNPPDNYRKKMMMATSNYLTYQNFENYGYQFQYVRNTLH